MSNTIAFEKQREIGLQLIEAVDNEDVEAVKSLLKQDVYIHTQDKDGRCALVAAAYKNNLEIAEILIKAGADVNMKDDTIQSAYLISTMAGPEGYLELLRMTLKAGGDVNSTDSDNGTGLIRASDRGHVDIIKELLTTNIRINHVNRIGWTALHEGVLLSNDDERHQEIVRMLLKAGIYINLKDKDGITPLGHAKKKDFANMIKILEAAGAKE